MDYSKTFAHPTQTDKYGRSVTEIDIYSWLYPDVIDHTVCRFQGFGFIPDKELFKEEPTCWGQYNPAKREFEFKIVGQRYWNKEVLFKTSCTTIEFHSEYQSCFVYQASQGDLLGQTTRVYTVYDIFKYNDDDYKFLVNQDESTYTAYSCPKVVTLIGSDKKLCEVERYSDWGIFGYRKSVLYYPAFELPANPYGDEYFYVPEKSTPEQVQSMWVDALPTTPLED